jgi:putative nucleotidyltransferase with HDIG domain
MISADIREFVYRACRRNENVLGPAFFDQHLEVVASCAAALAGSLGADAEIVELAAYLHDISAICDFTTVPEHPRLSAELASRTLLERGYAAESVARVAHSIASHSDPLPIGSAPPEDVCISNADALARILRPAYWLYFAFAVRTSGFAEGRQWLRSLLEKQWLQMVEPAKRLAGEQYGIALDILSR